MPATAINVAAAAAAPETLFSTSHAYQVLNVLAESINSVVYLAAALPLDQKSTSFTGVNERLVVLKKLPRALTACYELELHRRVHTHNNILPLLDCIVSEDAIYLVLEYCPAGDLFDAIMEVHADPTLTQYQRERWALRTFRELVQAVHWCHKQGVWHRDIKPENILLASDGRVQLTDFGLATEAPACEERGKGSLFYMAPELLAAADQPFGTGLVDSTHADVWSLGVLLLNMLGGRNPWPSAAYNDEAFQIYLAYPDELRKAFDLTDDAWFVIERMLSVDPHFRPSVEQVLSWTDIVERWIAEPVEDDIFAAAEAALAEMCASDLDAEIEAAAAAMASEWDAEVQVEAETPFTNAFVEQEMLRAVTDAHAVDTDMSMPILVPCAISVSSPVAALEKMADAVGLSSTDATPQPDARFCPTRCETYAPLFLEMAASGVSDSQPSSNCSRTPSLSGSMSSLSEDELDAMDQSVPDMRLPSMPSSPLDVHTSVWQHASDSHVNSQPATGDNPDRGGEVVAGIGSFKGPMNKAHQRLWRCCTTASPTSAAITALPQLQTAALVTCASFAAPTPIWRPSMKPMFTLAQPDNLSNLFDRLKTAKSPAHADALHQLPIKDTTPSPLPRALNSGVYVVTEPWPPYERVGTPACA